MARILVVDDDPSIRLMVVQKLRTLGHSIETAGDGLTALRLASEFRPEVAVLDWMMPRMTGLEVCQRIRQDPQTAGTYVILLTARSQLMDVRQGYAAGADDYVGKPFSPRELATKIEAALQPAARPGLHDLTYNEARRLAHEAVAAG